MRSAARMVVVGIALLMLPTAALLAQDADDELDFAPPRFGILVQTDFNAESPLVENGFLVRTSRLSVAGTAGSQFRYFVQANLLTNRAILDTRLGFRFTRALEIEVGLVKSPFSTEFMRFRGSLPLTERARVVIMLAPKRQIGATAIANVGTTSIRGGVYNGNGQFDLTNDGPGFLTIGRIDHRIHLNDHGSSLRFAVNAAYSRDQSAPVPGISLTFAGTRQIAGADAELTVGHFLVATEIIAARLRPSSDPESDQEPDQESGLETDQKPWGFSLTGGWEVVPHHRVVGRLDFLDSGAAVTENVAEISKYLAIVGYTFQPIRYAKFSVEYRYDVSNRSTNALVARFQLARK